MFTTTDFGFSFLSLFDGMSCGRIAIDRANFPFKGYFASEIDKHAIKESQANWQDIQHLGDVKNVRRALTWPQSWIDRALNARWLKPSTRDGFKQALSIRGKKIDVVMGGSPCQGFSFAGKQLAFNDPRSKLFFEYVKIVRHLQSQNPNLFFFLENVKMKKEHMAVISEQLGVEPVFINSSLVTAQNRQRWYWANWPISQPEDRGIVLNDIIEHFPMQNTTISDKQICRIDFNGMEEKRCLGVCFDKPAIELKEKALPLMARDYKGISKKQHFTIVCMGGALRGRYQKDGSTKQQLEIRHDGKSNALTTVTKDTQVVFPASIVGRRINRETGKRNDNDKSLPMVQCLQVKHSNDKSPCLTTIEKDCLISATPPGRYIDAYGRDDLLYRKLTVIECCRLQSVPDDYFKVSSKTQAYKMLGNGWTVDVIAHCLTDLLKFIQQRNQEVA